MSLCRVAKWAFWCLHRRHRRTSCCCWAGRGGSGQGRAGLSLNLIDQGQKVEVTSAARRRRSRGSGLYVDVGGGCGFGGRGLLLRTLAALGCPKTLHHRPDVAPPAAEGCAQTSNLSQVCRRTLCTAHRSPGFHSSFHTIVAVVATGLNSTALPLLNALSSTPGHRTLQLTSHHREPSTFLWRSRVEGGAGSKPGTLNDASCLLRESPPGKCAQIESSVLVTDSVSSFSLLSSRVVVRLKNPRPPKHYYRKVTDSTSEMPVTNFIHNFAATWVQTLGCEAETFTESLACVGKIPFSTRSDAPGLPLRLSAPIGLDGRIDRRGRRAATIQPQFNA